MLSKEGKNVYKIVHTEFFPQTLLSVCGFVLEENFEDKRQYHCDKKWHYIFGNVQMASF